jgi:hypothetical protein
MQVWRLPVSRDAFRVLGTLFWAERLTLCGPDPDFPDYHPTPRDPEKISDSREMLSGILATGFEDDDFDRAEDALEEIVKLHIIRIVEIREKSFTYQFLPERVWGKLIAPPKASGPKDEGLSLPA